MSLSLKEIKMKIKQKSAIKNKLCLAVMAALMSAPGMAQQIVAAQNFGPAGTYVPSVDNFNKKQVVLLTKLYSYGFGRYDAAGNYSVTYNSSGVPVGFTGNVDNCVAGTVNDEFRQTVIREANFYRAVAKLSGVRIGSADQNDSAQQAALISAANASLSHAPPTTSKCYSAQAALGASRSNLGLVGDVPGALSVSGFMSDFGAGNGEVGHRRWFLYPKLQQLGYGAAPYQPTSFTSPDGAVAVLVPPDVYSKPQSRLLSKPEFVAWPSPGYASVLRMPTSEKRWSFSCSGCSYTGATAEVFSNGASLLMLYEPQALGFGDPTLVFRPQGIFDTVQGGVVTRLKSDLTYDVNVKNVTLPSGVKKDFSYQVIAYDQQTAEETMLLPTYNVSDMWWAGSQENGWGISLTQGVSGAMFGTWYYYLPDGTPTWSIVIGNWESATRFSADVYATTGTSYAQASYDPAQFKVSPSLGKVSVDFSSASTATMNYTVSGSVGTKSISRLVFGGPKFTDGSNYTSQWWAGQAENGWGLSINQQFRTMFAVVYVYDAAGKPTWFTLSGEHAGDGSVVSNKIYAFNGSPLLGVPYDASRLVSREVGTAELKFGGDNNGTLTYTLNGVLVVKQISRLMF